MAKTNSTPAVERIPFKLGTPIFFEGVEIETLQYRRPKGRDMRRFMNSGEKAGDKLVRLWADLCELPEKLFDELDAEDWTRLAGEFGGFFFGRCPRNLDELIADLAWHFKWSLAELLDLDVDEIIHWHAIGLAQIERLNKGEG